MIHRILFVLLLHVLLPSSTLGFVASTKSSPVPITLQTADTNHIPKDTSLSYSIELVSSRDRALDVMVSRNWSPPLEEHLSQNPHLTNQEALQFLTRTYNDQGQHLMLSGGSAGELVQFVAIVDQNYYPKAHGVVGVVDVHRKPNSVLLELKNLGVYETARRQGIASALVEAVQEYARKISGAVYLNYDQDNEAAIRLYLSREFQLDPKEELKMIWTV